MKLNRLACSFLCLLLILALQGCHQKKDATSTEKTSSMAVTNNSASTSNVFGRFDVKATTNNPADSGNDADNAFNQTKQLPVPPDEITTRDGVTYRGVKVRKVGLDGLIIIFTPAGGGVGAAKLKFENLPSNLQQRYGYDPQKLVAYETENIEIVSQIVSDYHKEHTYVGKDIFVCGDMASDVWDIVVTKGIKAMIMAGNVDEDISSLDQANHAWVIAEVSPKKWLALETTGGFVVYPEENKRYYYGHPFSNPKELRMYEELVRQLQMAKRKFQDAMRNSEQFTNQYNQAPQNVSSSFVNKWNQSLAIVDQRIADMVEIKMKINALLLNQY